MKKVLNYLNAIPLDVKAFVLSCILILGIFLFPDEPVEITIFTTYIVFVFVSIGITGFYMTYVGDSKYNFFRNSTTRKRTFFTVVVYIAICTFVSYILAITEWFLFIFT